MKPVARILLASAALAAASCSPPPPPPPLSGVFQTRDDAGVSVQLRISPERGVELCTPVLHVPLRLAAVTLERDVFDAYHLRVSRLDSALNAEAPLSLISSLNPQQLLLSRALGQAEYVLRFCRVREQQGTDGGRMLDCESLVGTGLSSWDELVGADASMACESANACVLTDRPLELSLVHCLAARSDGGLSPRATLCEALSGAVPGALDNCLTSLLPGLNDAGAQPRQLTHACNALETFVSLGLDAGLCQQPTLLDAGVLSGGLSEVGVSIAPSLCAPIRELLGIDAGTALPVDVPSELVVEKITRPCGAVARLSDFEVSCCPGVRVAGSLVADGGAPANDGGRPDGGMGDAGDDGGTADSGTKDAGSDGGVDGGCDCLSGGSCRQASVTQCGANQSTCVDCNAGGVTRADSCGADGGCLCGAGPSCTGTSVCVSSNCTP